MLERKDATRQAQKNRAAHPGNGGTVLPPGFEAHPERRHNGAWKKTETARWKFEQIIKMTDDELQGLMDDSKAAEFERTCATVVSKARTMAAASTSPADLEKVLNMLAKLTDQVYGQPKQIVEQTNIELKPILPKKEKGKK